MCRSLPGPLCVKEIVRGLQKRKKKLRFDLEMTVDEGGQTRRLRRWPGKFGGGVVLGVGFGCAAWQRNDAAPFWSLALALALAAPGY